MRKCPCNWFKCALIYLPLYYPILSTEIFIFEILNKLRKKEIISEKDFNGSDWPISSNKVVLSRTKSIFYFKRWKISEFHNPFIFWTFDFFITMNITNRRRVLSYVCINVYVKKFLATCANNLLLPPPPPLFFFWVFK